MWLSWMLFVRDPAGYRPDAAEVESAITAGRCHDEIPAKNRYVKCGNFCT